MNDRLYNNGQRHTIQTLLCAIWAKEPEASNSSIVRAVLEFMPHSTYAEHRVQPDRNKYNKAKFKCQGGNIPLVPATNPEKRPMQQSETDDKQLVLL